MYPIFPVLAAGSSADWLASETLLDGLPHSCEVTGLILIFSRFKVTSRRSSWPCGLSLSTTCSHQCVPSQRHFQAPYSSMYTAPATGEARHAAAIKHVGQQAFGEAWNNIRSFTHDCYQLEELSAASLPDSMQPQHHDVDARLSGKAQISRTSVPSVPCRRSPAS